ncbi:ERF family protein [Aerococcaceae bacterium NML191219]|nr:ERF family protein [Aerococcaceae bacterium NML191219]
MADEKMTFTKKVITAQQALKAPKGQFNKFGNYSYRSAEDILEAVKPVNETVGLLLTITDSIEQIGDRYYIKATATLTDGENSVAVTAYAREALNKKGMDDSQITGSASSYARKYALNGLYLIDDAKDADTNEFHDQAQNPMVSYYGQVEPTQPTQEQLENEYKQAVAGYYKQIKAMVPGWDNARINAMLCEKSGVDNVNKIQRPQVIALLKSIIIEIEKFNQNKQQQQQMPYGG